MACETAGAEPVGAFFVDFESIIACRLHFLLNAYICSATVAGRPAPCAAGGLPLWLMDVVVHRSFAGNNLPPLAPHF